MKKLLIAALLFSGISLKAQHDISTDVLGFAFSKYGIGYDYLMNSNNSVGINFNFASDNMFADGKSLYGDVDEYSEMNIVPEYKFYATPNKGNDGIYIGVYAKYRSSNAKNNEFAYIDPNDANTIILAKTDVSTSAFGLGALAGYKWKTKGALFLEATFGIGKFVTNSVSYSNKVAEEMPKEIFNEDDYVPYIGNEIPVDLRINLKIGIRIGGNN
ncbi:MAG TPA: DUF3575 domain-containing protein [Vicingaceae bacterium]|nr:DUF3575 domain-containing protein [Vicingaceae bacterium]